MSLTVLSLFSGVGGLELGLEWAGLTTIGQVEYDPYCQAVLAQHWPEVPRHDDVRTAPAWWTNKPRPPVDVVCGGFPCQPFSNAGFMLGIADDRWGWPWMAEVIRAVGPRYVVVENVAALLRDADAFGMVLGDLASLGFDAEWAVLPASDFGAPHRRERVYLLAHPPGFEGGDRVGQGRVGEAPVPVGGLSGLASHQRRRAADAWLAREPRVDRLAHGIPSQVERLRVAGNAVVPQVAEAVGHRLMAIESHLEAS